MKKIKLETIETRGFILEISEFGDVVRQYHDTNQERFNEVSKKMISDHLNTYKMNGAINTNFHIYEY